MDRDLEAKRRQALMDYDNPSSQRESIRASKRAGLKTRRRSYILSSKDDFGCFFNLAQGRDDGDDFSVKDIKKAVGVRRLSLARKAYFTQMGLQKHIRPNHIESLLYSLRNLYINLSRLPRGREFLDHNDVPANTIAVYKLAIKESF